VLADAVDKQLTSFGSKWGHFQIASNTVVSLSVSSQPHSALTCGVDSGLSDVGLSLAGLVVMVVMVRCLTVLASHS